MIPILQQNAFPFSSEHVSILKLFVLSTVDESSLQYPRYFTFLPRLFSLGMVPSSFCPVGPFSYSSAGLSTVTRFASTLAQLFPLPLLCFFFGRSLVPIKFWRAASLPGSSQSVARGVQAGRVSLSRFFFFFFFLLWFCWDFLFLWRRPSLTNSREPVGLFCYLCSFFPPLSPSPSLLAPLPLLHVPLFLTRSFSTHRRVYSRRRRDPFPPFLSIFFSP